MHDFVASRVQMIGSAADFFADAIKIKREPMNHLPFLLKLYVTLYDKQ